MIIHPEACSIAPAPSVDYVPAAVGGMRKILIGIVGGTVLLFGILLIVLPGPAILVIPVGLGILATEYAWARACKDKLEAKWARFRRKKTLLNNRPGSAVE